MTQIAADWQQVEQAEDDYEPWSFCAERSGVAESMALTTF